MIDLIADGSNSRELKRDLREHQFEPCLVLFD
jgi:hypothetical protein